MTDNRVLRHGVCADTEAETTVLVPQKATSYCWIIRISYEPCESNFQSRFGNECWFTVRAIPVMIWNFLDTASSDFSIFIGFYLLPKDRRSLDIVEKVLQCMALAFNIPSPWKHGQIRWEGYWTGNIFYTHSRRLTLNRNVSHCFYKKVVQFV